MEKKFILNSTQIPNYLIDEIMPVISGSAFKVLIVIARQTYGWHKEVEWIAYSQLIEKTGLHRESVASGLKELKEKKLIEVFDKETRSLSDTNLSGRRQLFYRIKYKSQKSEKPTNEIEEKSEKPTFKSRKIEHTKYTNTKTLSKDNARGFKKPSCPLLNGSPLKEKYPNGHNECSEYIQSVEDRRGFKFINKAKQFMFIHKILKAGFGFDAMNKSIRAMERKYEKGAWDFSNMANWLEKGASNGNG